MKTREELVSSDSDYFIYAPSRLALELFLYPLQCGVFSYLPGYRLTRNAFDSFLLLYIKKGELEISLERYSLQAAAGQFVLLDCYRRHGYASDTGAQCLWCHFDGVTARGYYQNVVSRLGNVFRMPDSTLAFRRLQAILKTFYEGAPVREPLLSKYLTDILTEFLLYTPAGPHTGGYAAMAEEMLSYIGEHFKENLAIKDLAAIASLSPCHFIRVFKKETGFTPHEYLVNTRIAMAKYLLKNTRLSVKDICFSCGFSCESVFCSAFKKALKMTPAQYRAQGSP
ncbi:MAG: helix-turn-helix transcriptional regulator [Provencibacterium sp.]|jgi:AraC family transcriptional regulator|nr:helix-turn-helix transcriptional regulator [Provencibacterium sp.]